MLLRKAEREAIPEIQIDKPGLIRRTMEKALAMAGGNPEKAYSYVERWARKSRALFRALAEASIRRALMDEVTRMRTEERSRIARRSAVAPPLPDAVIVSVSDARHPLAQRRAAERESGTTVRRTALPVARMSTGAVVAQFKAHLKGLMLSPLPLLGKILALADADDLKDCSRYHGNRRRGDGALERWYALLWQEHPDRAKPRAQQRKVQEVFDAAKLQDLRARAEATEAEKVL